MQGGTQSESDVDRYWLTQHGKVMKAFLRTVSFTAAVALGGVTADGDSCPGGNSPGDGSRATTYAWTNLVGKAYEVVSSYRLVDSRSTLQRDSTCRYVFEA